MTAMALRWMLAVLTPLAAFAATPEQSAPEEPASAVRGHPNKDTTLDRYRRFDHESQMTDWRAANDEVGRLGGFMGHMRPASEHDVHTGAGPR